MSARRWPVAPIWVVGALAAFQAASGAPAPAGSAREVCADVGASRVCWDAAGAARLGARPAVRPVAPAFQCAGAHCVQRHARRPDDGEWTCVDTAGAVLCVGGEPAAGVVAGPPDPAWICGVRRGQSARDPLGPRVCVDFAPDFPELPTLPEGGATAWRCRSETGPAGGRVCDRTKGGAVLTASCDRAHPCVDGAICLDGRCVPARPAPTCWLDADCANGACRFGTCRVEEKR